MATTLYLDTARLGRMSPRAQAASAALLKLATDVGCSVQFEDLLYRGFQAWDPALQQSYRGLSNWQGLYALKDSLQALTGAQPKLPVFLANRTAELMRLAARLLFRRCKRVLLSDLEWPAYRAILEREARDTGGQVHEVPLRQVILTDRASPEEVVSLAVAQYEEHGCEGLFLSSVTYEGIRLPVRNISQALSSARQPPFVVVDGAQALCHAPAELDLAYCDFFLAGCHKWLRAYHPMGLGFCGREGSRGLVTSVCNEMKETGELADPLLHFTSWMEEGTTRQFTETVSLGPLFSCAGAVKEALDTTIGGRDHFSELAQTATKLEEVSLGTGWKPVVPHDELRSGILLLRQEAKRWNAGRPEEVRDCFQKSGVALTAYDGGLIRLSAPPEPWQESDTEWLRFALERTALSSDSELELLQAC
jgi:hypothetical protein